MFYLELIFGVIFLLSMLSFLSLVPWVPTEKDDLERINNIIKLKPGEKFLEIGCGTARVSLFLAKQNPNSTIHGIEFSLFLYLISKTKIFLVKIKILK